MTGIKLHNSPRRIEDFASRYAGEVFAADRFEGGSKMNTLYGLEAHADSVFYRLYPLFSGEPRGSGVRSFQEIVQLPANFLPTSGLDDAVEWDFFLSPRIHRIKEPYSSKLPYLAQYLAQDLGVEYGNAPRGITRRENKEVIVVRSLQPEELSELARLISDPNLGKPAEVDLDGVTKALDF